MVESGGAETVLAMHELWPADFKQWPPVLLGVVFPSEFVRADVVANLLATIG